jgi:predicted dehydrogenase/threonine dehydrogenase-like Zn-dependent dehydrogenase
MKQVLIRQGQAQVEDVPAPRAEPGTVLVEVRNSCISIGTEMSGVRASGLPLWKRALKQPAHVKKVFGMLAEQGFAATLRTVNERVGVAIPTGYSAAGVVLEVGAGVDDLQVGDHVACAGSQCAFHAEMICVPRNLTVRMPEGVSFEEASTVTLGAIALQGVRRAQPTLGETVVVIGLGILGQLTMQLLKANGCRVIGVDLLPERVQRALAAGMDAGLSGQADSDEAQVARLTDGIGADAVIITAATASDALVSNAFRMCRKKGRVVLVGDVGLNLNRADFYVKEIDFLISSSYGPGRYDERYESQGLDYPVAYVRWTENRNLAEFLRLIADQRVDVASMVEARFPIGEAGAAYAALNRGEGPQPLMVLLSYPDAGGQATARRSLLNPQAKPAADGQVRIAVVGAGGYAKGMHLPLLAAMQDVRLRAIVSRNGHNAAAAARQYGADVASTSYEEVLADPQVDAVLIATRHHLHAGMCLQALQAGKHVLVEKPMVLTADELRQVSALYEAGATAPGILLTGFNRRFSPYARRLREIVEGRSNPMLINYRMNAGYIPLDHWVHGPEGGGRNLGEACHIYDLFTFLTNSRVTSVKATAITPATGYYSQSDNFVATLGFEDGSVANLVYTALGSREHPKEQMELFVDGQVLVLDDYRKLDVSGSKQTGLQTRGMEKGQREELLAFTSSIRGGGEWPIPLWQQVQAHEIGLRVQAEIERHTGAPETIAARVNVA